MIASIYCFAADQPDSDLSNLGDRPVHRRTARVSEACREYPSSAETTPIAVFRSARSSRARDRRTLSSRAEKLAPSASRRRWSVRTLVPAAAEMRSKVGLPSPSIAAMRICTDPEYVPSPCNGTRSRDKSPAIRSRPWVGNGSSTTWLSTSRVSVLFFVATRLFPNQRCKWRRPCSGWGDISIRRTNGSAIPVMLHRVCNMKATYW
jgi:hypothetical protein